ncbi:MAG: hypothetical protein ACYDCF_08650 [Burkholderiales bacterium]
MAFGSHKASSDTYNAKYSKLLGQIYLESEAAKSVLGAVPDEIKRAGFNDKTSRELRKQIQDGGGLFDGSLEGKITYFAVNKGTDAKGIEREYIKVGMRTEVPNANGELKPATVFLSVPLKSDEGLSLMHKLANAQFGEDTKLSMFAQMKEGKDGRMYGNHAVGLKQNGETVKPVLPFPNEEREAMRAKLKSEGEDNEDIRKELLKAEYKKTLPQIEVVTQRFESYREERKAAGEDHGHEDAEGAADRQSSSQEEALPNEAAAQDRQKAVGDDMGFDDDMI